MKNNKLSYYQIPYFNDDVQKIFMDINEIDGRKYVKKLIETSLEIQVDSLEKLESTIVRVIKNAKNSTLDRYFLVNHQWLVDIEVQRKLDIGVLTDKLNFYQSKIIASTENKGKKYGEFYKVAQIVLYNGEVGNEKEFVSKHYFIPKNGKTSLYNKNIICLIQMDQLKEIHKRKGIEKMTWLERMIFFIKFRFKQKYKKDIEYIKKYDEEARYMDVRYLFFKNNQVEYLKAVKKAIDEKSDRDNERLLGRKEGFIDGEKQGFVNGEKQGFINGEKQGFINGEKQGIYKAIQNLMMTTGLSINRVMEMLNIPQEDHNIYIHMHNHKIQ